MILSGTLKINAGWSAPQPHAQLWGHQQQPSSVRQSSRCLEQAGLGQPSASHVLALMVSFQGNPLYFQSARNVTVNILNEKTKVLTRLVTGKEGGKATWKDEGEVKASVLWDAALALGCRRGAQVSCEVQMKTLLHFVETKLET